MDFGHMKEKQGLEYGDYEHLDATRLPPDNLTCTF
jgi:hypothetical protein